MKRDKEKNISQFHFNSGGSEFLTENESKCDVLASEEEGSHIHVSSHRAFKSSVSTPYIIRKGLQGCQGAASTYPRLF
jgi:hypothetical protein